MTPLNIIKINIKYKIKEKFIINININNIIDMTITLKIKIHWLFKNINLLNSNKIIKILIIKYY